MITEIIGNIFSFAPKSSIKAGDGLEEGDFPFYTSSQIITKRINTAIYKEESIILGSGGSPSIHYANNPFSTSTDCFVLTSKDSIVNIKFVYYYLLGNIHLIEKGFKGAGLKHVSKDYISKLEIPIFPFEFQNKLVALLDKLDSSINKRQKCIELLENLYYSFFIREFGDPIINPYNFNLDDLENISQLERGRFSPRPRNDPSYFGGRHPFIQTGDINSSNYRLNKFTQTLNEKGAKVSKKFLINDIVIAIVGATIGATAILKIDAYATDSIIGIRANSDKVNNIFLEMVLRFYRKVLLETAPEAARANINLRILGKIKIILPPLEVQEHYAGIYQQIEQRIAKQRISLSYLNQSLKSILNSAFNGQLNFIIDVELDSLIKEIDLFKSSNDLNQISNDEVYIQRLIDKLNGQEFDDKDLYDKAKHGVFQLLKENQKVIQVFNKKNKSVKLALK